LSLSPGKEVGGELEGDLQGAEAVLGGVEGVCCSQTKLMVAGGKENNRRSILRTDIRTYRGKEILSSILRRDHLKGGGFGKPGGKG